MVEKPVKSSGRGGAREGAGRKSSELGKSVPVSAAIPESLVAKLDRLQLKKGWNRSQAMTEAVKRLVRNVSLED